MTTYMSGVPWLCGGAIAGWGAAYWYGRHRRKRDGRFLSFVAHEFNSPLASLNMTILNFVHGVFGPMSKEHEEWMHLLKEQSSRLNFIVGGFQDFIHMDYHRDFRLHKEPVDLKALLNETVSGMQGSMTRSGARVEMSVPPDLPQVQADRDRLQRVLANVVEHAKKFRSSGSIRISLETVGKAVEFNIVYQGPKLGSQDVDKMLELYYPVEHTDLQLLPCVGLGLGVCRALVEHHGGAMTLNVDSAGSSHIRITLPRS